MHSQLFHCFYIKNDQLCSEMFLCECWVVVLLVVFVVVLFAVVFRMRERRLSVPSEQPFRWGAQNSRVCGDPIGVLIRPICRPAAVTHILDMCHLLVALLLLLLFVALVVVRLCVALVCFDSCLLARLISASSSPSHLSTSFLLCSPYVFLVLACSREFVLNSCHPSGPQNRHWT